MTVWFTYRKLNNGLCIWNEYLLCFFVKQWWKLVRIKERPCLEIKNQLPVCMDFTDRYNASSAGFSFNVSKHTAFKWLKRRLIGRSELLIGLRNQKSIYIDECLLFYWNHLVSHVRYPLSSLFTMYHHSCISFKFK